MLKNYLLIAWRTLKKNRLLTVINILGLSIGVTAAVVVYLVIDYNFSFDQYEPGRDRIYRIVTEFTGSKIPGVPAPLHAALTNVTGISDAAPLFEFYGGNTKVAIPERSGDPGRILKNQGEIVFTDAGYFSLFPHQWVAGDSHNALNGPNEIVLTQSRARVWFPDVPTGEVIGRTVVLSDSVYATVSGVVKDLDVNSDFEYQAFLSLPTIPFNSLTGNYGWDSWGTTSSGTQLLIRTNPGVQPETMNRQLAGITAAHLSVKDDKHIVRRLQPLDDIHTNTEFSGKINKAGLGSLAMLAAFLVLLGCINFINLSTAQGAQRAKEIGIRKTFGGSKKQLIFQFLTETFLLTSLTAGIAFFGVSTAIRYFIPGDIQPERVLHVSSLIVFFVCLIVVLTFLSGLYPAFILSRLQPVKVLKDQPLSGSGISRSARLRKVLTVTQFTIAQIFLIGVFVVNKQVHYAMEKDMGFRQNAIVNITLPSAFADSGAKNNLFCNRLRKMPAIENLSVAGQSPAFGGQTANKVTFAQGHKDLVLGTDIRTGDAHYLGVYGLQLISGRNIRTTDSATEFLVNETLARQMGFAHPADAVGHFLSLNDQTLPIVGVMRDFNQASVRTSIHPLVFYSNARADRTVHVAIHADPKTWPTTLAAIQQEWKDIFPEEDLSYTFIDEKIARFYKQEEAIAMLLSFAASIATLVSCIGLLGLAIFSINSRTKEIGIRKVLGASLVRLTGLLATGFVRPLLLAFVIAAPLAWVACHAYLQNFAFHTSLSWWVFVASGLIMISIAMATIAYHTLRAAVANPVDSLRTE